MSAEKGLEDQGRTGIKNSPEVDELSSGLHFYSSKFVTVDASLASHCLRAIGV